MATFPGDGADRKGLSQSPSPGSIPGRDADDAVWVCWLASQSSKLRDGVRFPDTVLFQAGIARLEELMLLKPPASQPPASSLQPPASSLIKPVSVVDRTTACEAVRPGSTPGHRPQVGRVYLNSTLEPDGAGNRLQPGRSGFDSHRRLLASEVLKALGQRRPRPLSAGWPGAFRGWVVTKARETATRLAQLAEHQADNLAVTGSIPVPQRRLQTCFPGQGNRRESVTRSPRVADDRVVRRAWLLKLLWKQQRSGSTDRRYAVRGYRFHARRGKCLWKQRAAR